MKPRKQRRKVTRKKIPSQRTTEVPEPTTFRFLSLPAEIRNMIYRRLLVPSKTDVSNAHNMETPIGPEDRVFIIDIARHCIQHGVSFLMDPTIMLLNHQVHAEYSAVYSERSQLLVNIWYKDGVTNANRIEGDFQKRDFQKRDFQRPAFRYLKSCKIFVNAGWVLSRQTRLVNPTDRLLSRFEVEDEKMEQPVRCLVSALKLMPRLESLKINYVNWLKNILELNNYRQKAGLEPFANLVGLRNVSIEGDVSDEYAANLRLSMLRSKTPPVRKTEESVED